MLTLALSPETYLALCSTIETRDGYYIGATNTCFVSRTPLTDENLAAAIERRDALQCDVRVTGSILTARKIILRCDTFIAPYIFHVTTSGQMVTCASMRNGTQYVIKFPLSEAYTTLMEWGTINQTLALYDEEDN